MARAHHIGQSGDSEERKSLARMDNKQYQTKIQKARKLIYKENHSVTSAEVERLLKEQSLVPTRVSLSFFMLMYFNSSSKNKNAFTEWLAPLGFNMYPIFVVDLLHEIELGTWRSLFIHLLRILECVGGGLVNELDCR